MQLQNETISHWQGRLLPAITGLTLAIIGVVLFATPDRVESGAAAV